MPFNTFSKDTPPFDNNDVRLALKYAAKRQEMVDKILLGYGEIGNDHSISPNQAYFNTDLPQREFDAEKARYHWKKTGIGDKPIQIHASEASLNGSVEVALLLQASAVPSTQALVRRRCIQDFVAELDGHWPWDSGETY
jgi:peptide/nickel transport system substrate-binding protein